MDNNEKRTALIATQSFSSFGKNYVPGDEIDPADASSWPDGTLEKRVEMGSIKATVIVVTEPVESAEDAAERQALMDAADSLNKTKKQKE